MLRQSPEAPVCCLLGLLLQSSGSVGQKQPSFGLGWGSGNCCTSSALVVQGSSCARDVATSLIQAEEGCQLAGRYRPDLG